MRRLIVSNLVSLDGFVAGPNGELDWFVTDGFLIGTEFGQYAREMISSVDAILLGRLTYQEFASYWPTLAQVEWGKWNNARLVKENAPQEVARMKQEPGKDLVIYGSGELVCGLMKLGLIDEYQLFVQPIVPGKGRPQFKDLDQRYNLKLVSAKPFKSGAVRLCYHPIG